MPERDSQLNSLSLEKLIRHKKAINLNSLFFTPFYKKKKKKKGDILYINSKTNEATQSHPLDELYKNKFQDAKKNDLNAKKL